MIVRRFQILILFIGCMQTLGCRASSKPADTAGPALKTFVTLLPQADFVRRIGGAHVRVGVLVGPGQSHHSYEPTPVQIAELSGAQVYFRIGVPAEEWLLSKVSAAAPGLRIVDTREGITLRSFEGCDHGTDGGHDDHAKGQKDPHIWLDPRLVARQAEHVCRVLSDMDAAHAAEFRANLLTFQSELGDLHDRITRRLAPFAGREILVFHPAYGYFADACGLKQVAIESEGKEPVGRQLAGLVERCRKSKTRVIFVQPQFASSSAGAIASAIDGKLVQLDPMPRDYIVDMDRMAEIVAESFADSNPSRTQMSSKDN